jgi:small subunit ribosomal protein S21
LDENFSRRIFLLSTQSSALSTTNLIGKEVKGGNMAHVTLKPNESQESLLRRFRKRVTNSGVLSTVRRKRWHISKSELRRIEKKKAIRRSRRRQRKAMTR